MSFLKDFKDDLSQAVKEVDAEEKAAAGTDGFEMVDTLDEPLADETVNELDLDSISDLADEQAKDEAIDDDFVADEIDEAAIEAVDEIVEEMAEETVDTVEEIPEPVMEDTFAEEEVSNVRKASDEITEITAGTKLTGNIESEGSINVIGVVTGDVTCLGKLTVIGKITGKSKAAEVFANGAKVDGDVESDGSVKIGNGTVIVGNIKATSAVIGGAVKGDIDVDGPVIVDATAVIKGNIKSRSVQINNGAVIDGFCSQAYADIDYTALFDSTFGK